MANFITHEIHKDYVIGIGGALNAALTGVPKGARQILLERGLWEDISHKVKDCAANKKKVKSSATVPATDDKDLSGDEIFENANGELQVACAFDFAADSEHGVGAEPVLEAPAFKHTATCCMTGALLNQSDFHAAHTAELFNMIQTRGHRCVFLPKFHSEFNPIERWWALMKTTVASTSLPSEYNADDVLGSRVEASINRLFCVQPEIYQLFGSECSSQPISIPSILNSTCGQWMTFG